MEEELPMLEITKRQKNIPWIEFGQVHVGSQFKKCLKVVNRRSEDVRLSLKLVGFQEGLSIEPRAPAPSPLVDVVCPFPPSGLVDLDVQPPLYSDHNPFLKLPAPHHR